MVRGGPATWFHLWVSLPLFTCSCVADGGRGGGPATWFHLWVSLYLSSPYSCVADGGKGRGTSYLGSPVGQPTSHHHALVSQMVARGGGPATWFHLWVSLLLFTCSCVSDGGRGRRTSYLASPVGQPIPLLTVLLCYIGGKRIGTSYLASPVGQPIPLLTVLLCCIGGKRRGTSYLASPVGQPIPLLTVLLCYFGGKGRETSYLASPCGQPTSPHRAHVLQMVVREGEPATWFLLWVSLSFLTVLLCCRWWQGEGNQLPGFCCGSA
jgi:hypothetical protein